MGDGFRVWGIRRRPAVSLLLKASPLFTLIQADLTDPSGLRSLPPVDHVVLSQAPRGPDESYEKTYGEGTRCLLAAFGKKPRQIVFVSSTGVYGTRDGSWVDEATDPAGGFERGIIPPRSQALLHAENLVLLSGIPSVILRLGGIYGPGRNRLRDIKEGRFTGTLTRSYTNRIHRDDAVSAIRLVMEKGKPGEIYLVVDDEPVTREVFYRWVYEKLDLAVPPRHPGGEGETDLGKRCSNAKIKALGLRLKYPSFREGYAALAESSSDSGAAREK